MNNNIKLSIIIPVYNVERYIIPCLTSVFNQGLDDCSFEVILVNDGTKDSSMIVINEILRRHDNIIVIEQENQGQSVARNSGLKVAKGMYILMIDSDDILIDNSLIPLLEIAIKTNVDLVVSNFLTKSDEEMKLKFLPNDKLEVIEKTGEELFLEDLSPHECFIWRSLYRREFLEINNLFFSPGTSPYEDVPFTHKCYLKANKCLRTNWIFYVYRRGQESSTYTSFSEKRAKEFILAIAKTWELKKMSGLNKNMQTKIIDDVYTSFSVMMSLTCTALKKDEIFRVFSFLRQQIPDMNFNNGLQQRAISFLINKCPSLFIHIRMCYAIFVEKKVILRFYYRLIYKLHSIFVR